MAGGWDAKQEVRCLLSMRGVLIWFPAQKIKTHREFRVTASSVGLFYFFHLKIVILCCMAMLLLKKRQKSVEQIFSVPHRNLPE